MHANRNFQKNMQLDGSSVTAAKEDPAMSIDAPVDRGVTYELCAGIVDKNLPLPTIIRQEILEECGYDVPEENLQRITSCRNGVGTSGSVQTMFFAEVTDAMQVNSGGGNPNEGEQIEVVYVPLSRSREFVFDETKEKPAGLLFAFMWFFDKFKVQ